jgi:uncharacterized lipoprotein YddW (UPF0748 family)
VTVLRRHLVPAALVVLLPAASHAVEGRAFWLTRWNARDQNSIASTIQGMQLLKANTLFIQVFGDGMALYDSDRAPRSPLVAGNFDALQAAITEGGRRNIEVHAYINVCNVYSGGLAAPSSASHLVRAHPEWAVVDAAGKSDIDLMGKPDTLIFFCPEWKGFRDYVVGIASEIATKYDVDGIHLDYLRFPGGTDRCFCSEHRKNFEASFGRDPTPSDVDFVEWRYDNITGLFGEIYDAVTRITPAIKVSASLITPTGKHFQDAKRILEAGKLDIAVPMIYTDDTTAFEENALFFHANSGGRLVYAGILSDGGVLSEEAAIARRIGLEGQSFFSWSTLSQGGKSEVSRLYNAAASPPQMPWKDGSADAVAPVMSQITVQGVLDHEATVLFHTDEKCRARVEYGLGTTLGLSVTVEGTRFDHAVRITRLQAASQYYFRAIAIDGGNNTTSFGLGTFITATEGPINVVADDGGVGFSRFGPWSAGGPGGFENDYLFSSDQPQETAWALWKPYLPRTGLYEVGVWWLAGQNRVSEARFTVGHSAGNDTFVVNQKTNGGRWNALGRFRFEEGIGGFVRLTNQATGGDVVVADAVRFLLVDEASLFIRGDSNGDGTPNISDAVATLSYLFAGGNAPDCLDAADSDDRGTVEITDAVYLLNHLFSGGPTLPPPYPAAGSDPTEDDLEDC